jgi:hypothetical protein
VNDSPSRILQCDKCKGEYFLSVVWLKIRLPLVVVH